MNWQLAVAALGVLATVISIGFNDQTARHAGSARTCAGHPHLDPPRWCQVGVRNGLRASYPCQQSARFTCNYETFRSGRCWVRTSDLLLVREALYH